VKAKRSYGAAPRGAPGTVRAGDGQGGARKRDHELLRALTEPGMDGEAEGSSGRGLGCDRRAWGGGGGGGGAARCSKST
jgi:hypothetical protein